MTRKEFFSFLQKIPKAELHLHLEAVISKDTIRKFYLRKDPSLTAKQVNDKVSDLFTYSNLDGFIQSYLAVQSMYETPADFDNVFDDLKNYMIRNGIVYAEVFAAPSAFIKNGWNFSELVQVYHKNIVRIQSEADIKVRLLIDVSRTFGYENAEKNLQLLLSNRIPEIIGIGLGGSEQKGPARLFGEVFNKARKHGLVTVAHAGEDEDAYSVWDAIGILHAARIGHGVSAIQDENLMNLLAEYRIPLDVCPSSNVFTKRFVKTLSEHPVRTFFKRGIIVTLSSDDPLFFGVELLDEYWNICSKMGFSGKDVKQIIKNSFTASFLKENEKVSYIEAVDKAWKQALADSAT